MSYKILTKNGIDNTNIDGARDHYFNAGMRDGIVKGALNEGVFATSSSNSIFLDACELRISGHRIVIDEPVYKTFENAPTTNTRYAYIAEIKVDDNSNVEFGLLVQSATTPLVKDNLFKTTKGKGTYQIEIGRFTLQTDGTITDLVRTADVITGGGVTKGAVQVGNVTTEKIDINLPAEVDIDQRFDEQAQKEYLDFKFHLPIDLTEIDNRTQQSATDSAEAKRLATEANDRSKTALSTADGAMDIAEEANTNSNNAVNTANEADRKATSAEAIAGEANTKSDQAVETANNADKTATEAKSVAEQADLTADSALTVAGAAADTANSAEETANQANTTSQEAKTVADNAVSTATSANKTANDANDKSDTAISTANSAKDTAEGIDAKATEALSNSETAISTADEAKQLAEQSVSGQGTKVTVGGIFQSEFDADIKANQADLTTLATRVIATETKNDSQDKAIAKAQSTADGAVSKNNSQDTAISALETMLGAMQKQVESLESNKVNKSGDTMTGPLTLPSLADLRVTNDGPENAAPNYICVFNNDAAPQGLAYCSLSAVASQMRNYIYPVGSIYLSRNNVSPASFIGGTWTPIGAGYALWTTDSDGGGTIEAGLPNIEGRPSPSPSSDRLSTSLSGCFGYRNIQSGEYAGVYNSMTNTTSRYLVYLDASRSNSVYGKSSTVQPRAYKVYAWQRTV